MRWLGVGVAIRVCMSGLDRVKKHEYTKTI